MLQLKSCMQRLEGVSKVLSKDAQDGQEEIKELSRNALHELMKMN